MSLTSSEIVLYDLSGNALPIQNGAVTPANTPALMIAGSDGTNSRYILTDNTGKQIVIGSGNFTVTQATAANLNATITGTVISNIGTTNGLALDATLAKLTIAQSAALGANTNALIAGSVTTAAPVYVAGNINPLSLTLSGALRVDGSGVTQPISGTLTSNQGAQAALANAWATKITDATNGPVAVKAASTAALATDPSLVVSVSPNNTVLTSNLSVSAAGFTQPSSATYVGGSDGANLRAISTDASGKIIVQGSIIDKATMNAGAQAGVPIVGQSSGVGRLLTLNRLGHAAPGYQTTLSFDPVEGTTINSWLWTQSTVTMTIAQTSGLLTLNSGAITTITTDAIITTNRQFPIMNQSPIGCSFRASVVQTTNTVQEIGFGAPIGVTALISNGSFFRITAGGQVRGVNSYNGAESTSGLLGTLLSTSYYLFIVIIDDNGARFIVEDSNGIPLVDSFFALGLTIADKAAVTHVPAFARVYTTGTAGIAPQIKISSFQSWQYNINTTKDWSEQLAGTGRSSNINPTTFAQTSQLVAAAAPATTTPINTASAYATLGGEYVLNVTASSESLLGIFGFQVPAPYQFYLNDILFPPPFITTGLGATVNIQEWCLMVANSANPSTATGQRYTLGTYTAVASAIAGTVMSGQAITFSLKTPIVVNPGQFLLVMVKMISGSAVGVYRGSMFINGYFE